MRGCRTIRRAIAAGAPGAPAAAVKEHSAVGDECRREFDEVQKILDGADAVREEMEAVSAGVDWDALSRRIADAALAGRSEAPARQRAPFWKALLQPRWRPAFAGVLTGLLLGSLSTYMLFKRGPAPAPKPASYSASREFIDRVELEMAKRETIDYLEKSEYVILDLVQTPAERAATAGPAAADRLKALLSQKRYFNAGLEDVRMAKAREICDQIEFLFLELSQLSDALTVEETAKVQKFVEDKQLLLKIRLLKKELRGGEV